MQVLPMQKHTVSFPSSLFTALSLSCARFSITSAENKLPVTAFTLKCTKLIKHLGTYQTGLKIKTNLVTKDRPSQLLFEKTS